MLYKPLCKPKLRWNSGYFLIESKGNPYSETVRLRLLMTFMAWVVGEDGELGGEKSDDWLSESFASSFSCRFNCIDILGHIQALRNQNLKITWYFWDYFIHEPWLVNAEQCCVMKIYVTVFVYPCFGLAPLCAMMPHCDRDNLHHPPPPLHLGLALSTSQIIRNC